MVLPFIQKMSIRLAFLHHPSGDAHGRGRLRVSDVLAADQLAALAVVLLHTGALWLVVHNGAA